MWALVISDVTEGLSTYSFEIAGLTNGDLSDLTTGYYDEGYTDTYIFSMG
jgi:hypothetical protein